MTPKIITLAMTGASGAEFTLRLMGYCLSKNIQIQFITSKPGQIVMGIDNDLSPRWGSE